MSDIKPKKVIRKRKPRKKKRSNKHHKSAFLNGLNRKYLSFEEAKAYIATVPYITTKIEYQDWCRVKKFTFLPITPNTVYRREWKDWPDYLGTDSLRAFRNKDYYSFYDAIGIIHKLAIKHDLKTQVDWFNYYDDQYLTHEDDRDLPIDRIPKHPCHKYEECKTYAQWLGRNIKSKVDEMQHRQKMVKEIQEDIFTKYQGQPVFAITSGVDPINENLIKIIADHSGLASLVTSVEHLQYDILAVFIFDKNGVAELTQTLISNGLDYGDNCYLINNMSSLLYDMRNIAREIPSQEYRY